MASELWKVKNEQEATTQNFKENMMMTCIAPRADMEDGPALESSFTCNDLTWSGNKDVKLPKESDALFGKHSLGCFGDNIQDDDDDATSVCTISTKSSFFSFPGAPQMCSPPKGFSKMYAAGDMMFVCTAPTPQNSPEQPQGDGERSPEPAAVDDGSHLRPSKPFNYYQSPRTPFNSPERKSQPPNKGKVLEPAKSLNYYQEKAEHWRLNLSKSKPKEEAKSKPKEEAKRRKSIFTGV